VEYRNKPKRNRRRPNELRDLVSQFERSNLSRAAFCRKHALSPSTFKRWRRVLTTPEEASVGSPETDTALFVQLDDAGGERASRDGSLPLSSAPAWDVELQIGEAMVLRLRRPC